MYGIEQLKSKITVTKEQVECPVNGCKVLVVRQRNVFQKEPAFYCPDHHIYISPSTFEYCNEQDNILWDNPEDISLLCKVKRAKRESRMARDNSEDAITWNVFRYLENTDLLDGLLGRIGMQRHNNADIMYWSYNQHSQDGNQSWPCLNHARREFGEQLNRSSEPDIIVKTDKTLFFIECKLGSGNNTTPKNEGAMKKYKTGGNDWFSKVFRSEYEHVAICEKKYELMRFWLLGTWLADQLDLQFCLVNLVPEKKEHDIEERFSKHIHEGESRRFVRASWENIYEYIKDVAPEGLDKDKILHFYKNKTLGYNSRRELMSAFTIE